MYNRVMSVASVVDNQAPYTYTTGTWRQAGAQTYNNIVFLVGIQEDAVLSTLTMNGTLTAFSGTVSTAYIGIGVNSTTTPNAPNQRISNGSANSIPASMTDTINILPQLGVSTVYSLELGDGSHANTFNVNSGDILTLMVRS